MRGMKTGTLLENITAFSIYDKNTGESLGERQGQPLGLFPLGKGHTEFHSKPRFKCLNVHIHHSFESNWNLFNTNQKLALPARGYYFKIIDYLMYGRSNGREYRLHVRRRKVWKRFSGKTWMRKQTVKPVFIFRRCASLFNCDEKKGSIMMLNVTNLTTKSSCILEIRWSS